LAKQISFKPEEISARSYADRLILEKLTEMEAAIKLSELTDRLGTDRLGLAAVRSLLASNPARFAYAERRWIPASRVFTSGRPLVDVIYGTLHAFGGPMPSELLIAEVARVRKEDIESIQPVVERLIQKDSRFVTTLQGSIALTEWSFVAYDETTERALALNGLTAEEVQIVEARLGVFDWRQEDAVAKAVAKVAPVSLRALGAACWNQISPQDPRSVLLFDARTFARDAFSTEGYEYLSDGKLYPNSETHKWLDITAKMIDKLPTDGDFEDVAPMEIKPEDVDRLVKKIVNGDSSTTAAKLLEEFFEITPGTKTFTEDLGNMIGALQEQSEVVWVGGDRFRRSGNVPDYIDAVPEPFYFIETDITDEEGELVDVELNDDGLSTSLRKLLTHPLAMDVLDEDLSPAPKQMPESIRLVLKSIHRELGTFPLCQLPSGFLSSSPNVQELIVVDDHGRELNVWVNQSARLTYNWIDWWFEQSVESGAVFTLTKTNKPNVFEFAWMDQPDPVVHITSQRMEELRNIGMAAEGRGTYQILMDVFGHWPKGADFLTLLAEVNVVRRSSRRLVASLLSSYQCFYQRSGSPVWHFDAKKIELGFDKTKRKFVKK
jgi:hypothetical protein